MTEPRRALARAPHLLSAPQRLSGEKICWEVFRVRWQSKPRRARDRFGSTSIQTVVTILRNVSGGVLALACTGHLPGQLLPAGVESHDFSVCRAGAFQMHCGMEGQIFVQGALVSDTCPRREVARSTPTAKSGKTMAC